MPRRCGSLRFRTPAAGWRAVIARVFVPLVGANGESAQVFEAIAGDVAPEAHPARLLPQISELFDSPVSDDRFRLLCFGVFRESPEGFKQAINVAVRARETDIIIFRQHPSASVEKGLHDRQGSLI